MKFDKINITKSIILTLLFYILIELIGTWILLIPNVLEKPIFLNVYQLINSIIGLIILALFFKTIKRIDLLKFNKTEIKYYILAPILGVGFVFSQPFLNVLYHLRIPSELFQIKLDLKNLANLNIIAMILIVPFTEEFFFRSYIQGELTKKYNTIIAILVASVLFAFIHIPFESLLDESNHFSLHQAFIALFGGLISGILFYKTKSITPSIIFHIFWNLTSYVL